MKRFGNLWSKICEKDNLLFAHECAQKDKKYYREVKMVNRDLEHYIEAIHQSLVNKTYKITADDYEVSEIEDKGKVRELWKLSYYPHRIIQWAIMLQLENIFMKTFCDHTCASLKGRGGNHAYNLVRKYMKDRKNTQYCLKMDISKFYPNINHSVLKQLLRKKFKDRDLLEMLDMVIDSYPGEIGLPIGSYLSQFLANFYLAYFDHWLKEDMGVKMVVRYMDDIVIFGPTTRYLRSILDDLTQYLQDKLHLKVKNNWQIFPTDIRGVDFIGYRFFFDYVLLRKTTAKKLKKKLIAMKVKQDQKKLINRTEFCMANSYIGWILKCNSWRLFTKYIEPIIPSLTLYHGVIIHKNSPASVKTAACAVYRKHLEGIRQQIAKEV